MSRLAALLALAALAACGADGPPVPPAEARPAGVSIDLSGAAEAGIVRRSGG